MTINKSNSLIIALSSLFLSTASDAVVLTTNLAGANFIDAPAALGPNGETVAFRWNGIANTGAGAANRIDLVVSVATGSSYIQGTGPNNTNGPSGMPSVPSGATLIKVEVGTDVTFDFNFYRGNGQTVALTTDISFLDFDQTDRTSNGQGVVTETLTFLGVTSLDQSSYTYTASNNLDIDTNNAAQPIFSSTQEGDASDNPTDLNNLSVVQQQKIVEFNLVEATGFSLNLAVGGTTPDNDARSFFIAGGNGIHRANYHHDSPRANDGTDTSSSWITLDDSPLSSLSLHLPAESQLVGIGSIFFNG